MKKTNETPEETELWNSIPNLDKKDRGDTYFRLSLIAFEKGLHANSLTLAESACDAYKESGDEVGLANAYTAIAFNFYVTQKAKDGIKYMSDAVNLYTKNSDEQEWEYRNHLLRWYMQEEQYELAKEQLFVLLEHYENDGAEYSLVEARKLLGISYCNLDDCDAAIKEFTTARVLAKELQDSRSIAELDLELSQCFNHLEKPIESHNAATKAAGVFSKKDMQFLNQFSPGIVSSSKNATYLVSANNPKANLPWYLKFLEDLTTTSMFSILSGYFTPSHSLTQSQICLGFTL